MLGGQDTRVIYRHYATLYFVFVVDESESELGILDLIQVKGTTVTQIRQWRHQDIQLVHWNLRREPVFRSAKGQWTWTYHRDNQKGCSMGE